MIAFTIAGLPIHWYGIFYLVAFIAAYLFFVYFGRNKVFNGTTLQNILTQQTDDLIMYGVLGVLLGGRVGHVLLYDTMYFLSHPLKIFAIREGGMSIVGGILGVTIALLLFKKKRKLSTKEFLLLGDTIFLIAPLGLAIGRIGNYLNQELYGRPVADFVNLTTQTTQKLLDIGLLHVYDKIDTLVRINTNFLSSFFEGILGLIIVRTIFKRNNKFPRPGYITGIYLIYYGIQRFGLEYLRADALDYSFGIISMSQVYVFPIIALGIFVFYIGKKAPTR